MTKPEGPAQEPQCCIGGEWDGHTLDCYAAHQVPQKPIAAPAPSQPADWLSAIREVLTSDKSDAAKLIAVGILASSSEPLTEAEIKRGQQIWNEHGAPSQPAGAREWRLQWGWNGAERTVFLTHDGRDGIRLDADSASYIRSLMELAQQTAAKDAELKAVTAEHDRLQRTLDIRTEEHKAAERERDSLREALMKIAVALGDARIGEAGLICDAALKAGKDGQNG